MGPLFALPLYDTSRHLVTSWKFPPPANQRARTEEPAHRPDQSESSYSRRSATHCRPASATRRCIRQPDAVPGLGCDSRAARKTQTSHRDQSVTKEQENRPGWNRKCPRLGSAPFWPVKRAKARTHGVCMCALAVSRARVCIRMEICRLEDQLEPHQLQREKRYRNKFGTKQEEAIYSEDPLHHLPLHHLPFPPTTNISFCSIVYLNHR